MMDENSLHSVVTVFNVTFSTSVFTLVQHVSATLGHHQALLLLLLIGQKLPLEIETKLIEFQHFVIGLHRRNKYSLSQISNADETAVISTCLTIIP
jgi:hypothetical protein